MDSTHFRYCPRCRTELEAAWRGGKERLSCPSSDCSFVHWDNPVPVVAAIVQHREHVILVRSKGNPESWFGLVAGFVESGESIEEAVLREVAEEIGIEAGEPGFIGSYPFELRNQILFVYHIETDVEEIRLDTEELADYKRVPIDRLVPWSRGTGHAVREWLASLGYQRKPVDFGEHMTDVD